jgi:two-component system phosphate regulon sensor histidine kinase PhoR
VATDSLNNDKIATNPEKVKYYSKLIKQENLRMKKQVENVLNMSKLERNEMKLFLKETNVRELIKEISKSFRLIVEERNGTLTEEFKAEHYLVRIDEFHLSNALINLLDNANKYSPKLQKLKFLPKTKATGISFKFLIKEWEWNNKTKPKFSRNSSEKKQEIYIM